MTSHRIYLRRAKKQMGQPEAYKTIMRAAKAALNCENINTACEINVLLTDNAGIRAINLEFRNLDRATDVLSFPMSEQTPGRFDPEKADWNRQSKRAILGDIVISLEQAAMQAKEYGHSFEREVSYLTVHSVLHLLGYDHTDEAEQKRLMRQREDSIMLILEL
jgi:probable rRNA maturation factor